MTRRADYSSGLNAAYKAAAYNVSSIIFAACNPADKLAVKCQRAIAAAAQRTRCAIALSAPGPAAGDKPGSIAAPGARAASSVHLTPARWQAINWRCQSWLSSGSGGAVPARTGLEPLKNHQSIVIAALSARFQRFQLCASRDARMGPRMSARACRGAVNAGTLEPLIFIYIYQVVSGSKAVLVRFSLEPLTRQCRESGGIARFLIKLGTGYWLTPTGPDRVEGSSTVNGSRGAKSFGDFAPGLGGRQLERRDLTRCGENGGNLPFLARRSGLVGRVMLEGWPQGRGNGSVVVSAPLPVRLGRRARGGIDWTWHPPLPPFAPRPLPCTLALETDLNSADLRPDQYPGHGASHAEPRQSWNGNNGSGLGGVSACRAKRGAGRVRAAVSSGIGPGLRRSRQASAGGGHVN